MDRKTPRFLVAAALCAAALSFAPRTAHAYDVNGVGIGADVGLAGPTGVALTFGLGRLELEVLAGLSLNLPDGGVLEPDMWISGGAFFILADGPQTNFLLGGRIGAILDSTSVPGPGGEELDTRGLVLLEADMRVEHRFDEHFVMTGHVGMVVAIDPDGNPDFSLGLGNSGLVGGFGFRYFFDPLGESAPPAPATAAAPARRSEPAAEPAASGTSEGGEQQQPYWE